MPGDTTHAFFGAGVVVLSALLGGTIVSLGHPGASLATIVPIVAGLIMVGKEVNSDVLEVRPWLHAVDAGGILLAFYSGVVVSGVVIGNPWPETVLWALLAVAAFVLIDRAIARRVTGSWLGTRQEVAP